MKKEYHRILATTSLLLLVLPVIAQDTLTLGEAIRIGLENNFSIRVAKNDFLISKNNNSLGNAGFLPNLSANAGDNLSIQNTEKNLRAGGTESSDLNTTTLSGSVALNWTLFDGFSMFITRKQLGNLEKQGDLKLRMAVEDAVGSIIITFYELIQQQKQINSLEESLKLSRERLRIAKEKSKIGAGYQLLEIQADVDLHADSSNLLKQENIRLNLLVELNYLLGRDPGVKYEIREIPIGFSIQNTEDVLTGLNGQNAELLYDRLTLDNKELNIKYYQAGRYPKVGLTSSYGLYNYNYSAGGNLSQRIMGPAFGITASINLFNGFNLTRNIKNARIQLETQQVLYSQKDILLRSYVLKYLNDFNLAMALIKTEEVSMKLATQNLTIAMEKYKLGAISDFELREIQKKLLDSQSRYYSAQLLAKSAEIELKILSGILLNDIQPEK